MKQIKTLKIYAVIFSSITVITLTYFLAFPDSEENLKIAEPATKKIIKKPNDNKELIETQVSESFLFEEIEVPETRKNDPLFKEKVIALKRNIEKSKTPAGELTENQFRIAMELATNIDEQESLIRMRVTNEFNEYFYRDNFDEIEEKEKAADELFTLFDRQDIQSALTPGEAFEAQRSIVDSLSPDSKVREKLLTQLQEMKIKPALENKISDAKNRKDSDVINHKNEKEQLIVQEVSKMDSIPDNMTRQEYFKYRIEKLYQQTN